jgi:hypothetical protein
VPAPMGVDPYHTKMLRIVPSNLHYTNDFKTWGFRIDGEDGEDWWLH